MKQNRRGLAAVSINSSLLWLLGSDTITDAQFSTEFISLNEGLSVLGPRMPLKIDGSCVVKYDDTTIYILGTLHRYHCIIEHLHFENCLLPDLSLRAPLAN